MISIESMCLILFGIMIASMGLDVMILDKAKKCCKKYKKEKGEKHE